MGDPTYKINDEGSIVEIKGYEESDDDVINEDIEDTKDVAYVDTKEDVKAVAPDNHYHCEKLEDIMDIKVK